MPKRTNEFQKLVYLIMTQLAREGEVTPMNAESRKLISKAVELMGEARALLEDAREGEQDAYDNMPESRQASPRGVRRPHAEPWWANGDSAY